MARKIRPPIVTILGHVDHGKTTLLDFIRKSQVAAKEEGRITQHIGAYQVEYQGKLITFIDTPGHSAFEKMRSRGARVADMAVLVVAVDDGVMPQTLEAIKHIKQAKIPVIVALNKVDLPKVDIKVQKEKIKKQLSDSGVLVEEYGGDTPIIPLSAKTGQGVDKLLEMILLVAEMQEISGEADVVPEGVVIEANLDKFKGPTATVLIRNGTLRKGDQVSLGGVKSKIRGIFDYNSEPIDEALPSTPVEIIGLEKVPEVGAMLGEESKESREAKVKEVRSLIDKLKSEQTNVLNIVVKADNQGSLEAVLDGLNKDHAKVVSSGTGEISENDIKLAESTHAVVIGFNTKTSLAAKKLAEVSQVLIRQYTVIYELLSEVEEVVEGMLKAGALEEIYGTAQILAEFDYGKTGKIAGCKVLDGNISKGPRVKILREKSNEDSVRANEVLGETKIKSLKKGKEEVSKVEKGMECGIMFDPPLDFKIGDIIQSFRTL